MIWPVNYSLYAAATMFTLFFAGKTYAPAVKIDGENAQDWLVEKYLSAFRHCYRRLKNCGAIAGWGAMNEPHPGYIGSPDLNRLSHVTVAKGAVPDPFRSMLAASGASVKVPVYTPWTKGWMVVGRKVLNPNGISIFREGYTCPWKQAGVWAGEAGDAKLLRPDHFSLFNGRPARFADDFLKPFILRFAERMKEADRPVLFFIEGIPHGDNFSWGKDDPPNMVNAFHHYDGITLFTKTFKPYFTADHNTGRLIFGRKKVAAEYSSKLAAAKKWAGEQMENMPCLLGEFGLPFDLDNKKAFRTGDYSAHEEALSLYYDGIDENLLSSTIWNYSSDNNNEKGDHWNDEDLSIVANGEGRAIGGWLRPYPMATAGIPLKFKWDRKNKSLLFLFRADPAIAAPTELFLPSRYFSEKPVIAVNGSDKLTAEYKREEQRLFIFNDGYAGEAELRVN